MIVFTLTTLAATCSPTADHGCLNGYPYDWATQFSCGRHKADGTPGIYNYTEKSCCAQGLPFDPSKEYCCYSGIWSFDQGPCSAWTPSFPRQCYCTPPEEETPASPRSTLIDTTKAPKSPACSTANSTSGCMNGWDYDFSLDFPCGKYLMDFDTYGCCATANGLEPYQFKTQSCCKLADAGHELRSGGHACDCRKYGC